MEETVNLQFSLEPDNFKLLEMMAIVVLQKLIFYM